MSDIQELIHKTSMDCIDKGKRLERERIIKLLEDSDIGRCCFESHDLIALIKGEK